MDIGFASDTLSKVLGKYNYKNLDDLQELKGQNTTTEFMCYKVFEGIVKEVRSQWKGVIKVKIAESHKAWASYEDCVE